MSSTLRKLFGRTKQLTQRSAIVQNSPRDVNSSEITQESPNVWSTPEEENLPVAPTGHIKMKTLIDTLSKLTLNDPNLHPLLSVLEEIFLLFEGLELSVKGQEHSVLLEEIKSVCASLDYHLNKPSRVPISTLAFQGCVQLHFTKSLQQISPPSNTDFILQPDANYDFWSFLRDILAGLERLLINSSFTWTKEDATLAERRLNAMPISMEGIYDYGESVHLGRARCLPGTRVELLAQLGNWAQDYQTRIFWLNGMAGSGKTTVAYSFCEQLDSTRRLAASFFCSRQLPSCRDINRIVPSISYQLARYSLPFAQAISSILAKTPDAHTLPIHSQLIELLVKPLNRVKESLPCDLVIVIDALDECGDGMLDFIVSLLSTTKGSPAKFFLSSRPEPEVLDKIPRTQLFEIHIHELGQTMVHVVKEDIRTYLQTTLSRTGFVSEADIDQLVERSGVLFIYAATVVRYISQSSDPARLRKILGLPTDTGRSTQHLDRLYDTILAPALGSGDKDSEEAKLILCTIVCALEPLSTSIISELLLFDERAVVAPLLERLVPVIQVSSSQVASTIHASFTEYLLDANRSGTFFATPTCTTRG
ncbi:Vegetative incompatibility protein HET-E-1 [Ceratobasidium sp. AG-Ba]|nr:Vegetative incompatibility protein HET-E-1 [Ceratobasidium sp. AG-Ba]